MRLPTLVFLSLPITAYAAHFPRAHFGRAALASASGTDASTTATSTDSATTTSATDETTSVPSSSASINATTTTTTTQPTQTIDPATAADIATLLSRRLSNIVGELSNATLVGDWLPTQNSSGAWPDIDYTTGCTAQRANWPAEIHLNRLATLSGAWHGALVGAEQYAGDPTVLSAAHLAMDFWFDNDMTNLACLDQGGTTACPCDGSPGLWNTNWFPGIIGVPEVVSTSCLLLNSTLTPFELDKCTNITGRAYNAFVIPAHQVGVLTGANLLDVAKIGIDLGLLTTNLTLLNDAYGRIHNATVIVDGPARADGIRPDGAFGQHTGIIYNGNYGKDLTNDVVDLEVEAGGTMFQAEQASMDAMATLFTGDHWMIYYNALTKVLHWDFSVLGRFIAFPTTDVTQATASILLNLTKIGDLGAEWKSDALINFSSSLQKTVTNANAGSLVGNKMFFTNDYMVQRNSYVTTLKMTSVRSVNTECTNLANPFGFHLATGALRTYVSGNEYENIAASMDWNLIPGITTDYGNTPLNCAQTGAVGIENYVGGVSDGSLGVSAFRYTNPLTKALSFQKTYFFMGDDVQLVMISNITSTSNASVISVLDQKRLNGDVVLNSHNKVSSKVVQDGAQSQTLWHDNVGYSFSDCPEDAFLLTVDVQDNVVGNWTNIGTSPSPPTSVNLFSAFLTHESLNSSLAYTIYPGVSQSAFASKVRQNTAIVVENSLNVSSAIDSSSQTLMAVFWQAGGGSADFSRGSPAQLTISANDTVATMLNLKTGVLTVADPTQTLSSVSVTVIVAGGQSAKSGKAAIAKTVVFELPGTANGLAGSSVSQNVL